MVSTYAVQVSLIPLVSSWIILGQPHLSYLCRGRLSVVDFTVPVEQNNIRHWYFTEQKVPVIWDSLGQVHYIGHLGHTTNFALFLFACAVLFGTCLLACCSFRKKKNVDWISKQ